MGKQVSLRTELKALVDELDLTHEGAFPFSAPLHQEGKGVSLALVIYPLPKP
jgi:hypothetical protein